MDTQLAQASPPGITTLLAKELAAEVTLLVRQELARSAMPGVQPRLYDVRQAAVYLGRSEQAVQHLIFDKAIPVVRIGKRVHLDREDMDDWIEQNKY